MTKLEKLRSPRACPRVRTLFKRSICQKWQFGSTIVFKTRFCWVWHRSCKFSYEYIHLLLWPKKNYFSTRSPSSTQMNL